MAKLYNGLGSGMQIKGSLFVKHTSASHSVWQRIKNFFKAFIEL